MTDSNSKPFTPLIYVLVFLGGAAALSWEVLWQLRVTLALGASAQGAAITFAALMGGMCLGSLVAGRALEGKVIHRPLRVYGYLEACIGIFGVIQGASFRVIEHLDVIVFRAVPSAAPFFQILTNILVISLPSIAMGASIPLFSRIARENKTSVSVLYGLNTFGAALGTLAISFCLLPRFGIQNCALVVSAINGVICLCCYLASQNISSRELLIEAVEHEIPESVPTADLTLAFLTGFVTFALEVAWFRALRAALMVTTQSFAVILCSVLLSLALAARISPRLQKRAFSLYNILILAGVVVLVTTPMVERFDLFFLPTGDRNSFVMWFLATLIVIGPPMALIGLALPWILDRNPNSLSSAKIYGMNTLGAILGSLGSAWILLPLFGFSKSAWILGLMLGTTAIFCRPDRKLRLLDGAPVAAFVFALFFHAGIGKDRIVTGFYYGKYSVLDYFEGPDATVSALEFVQGGRALFIDGFAAATEWGTSHYMEWMGKLPVKLHGEAEDALVICFGTGQTANAVRQEGIKTLDIVDINRAVFGMGKWFPANKGVLDDPRVLTHVMDGRAWLRRTEKTYDVITLEPMPPNHAGVNALYSKEFYELARARLRPGGIIAQWLPAHLVSGDHARAIAKTFGEVFPTASVWVDPKDNNAILIGSEVVAPPGEPWKLSDGMIETVTPSEFQAEYQSARVISDDNQLLAFGKVWPLKKLGARPQELVAKETDPFERLPKAE